MIKGAPAKGRFSRLEQGLDWHKRFLQQARWTKSLRDYLFDRALPPTAGKILEIGCGTGAILSDLIKLSSEGRATLHGIDLQTTHLAMAQQHASPARLACADAYALPYRENSFHTVFCHYLFLWLQDPAQALREMQRVAMPGGSILAMAEPDYGGRIDYPEALARVGKWQAQALQAQGANPRIGRQLAMLFNQAGLIEVESGVLGAQWKPASTLDDFAMEWQVIRNDLAGKIPAEDLEALERIDLQANRTGERVLFVPTFYAWGRVPKTQSLL
jgi:ubiquinone/menaquinone biosynthesis C-methylase UbiE